MAHISTQKENFGWWVDSLLEKWIYSLAQAVALKVNPKYKCPKMVVLGSVRSFPSLVVFFLFVLGSVSIH